MDMQELKNIRDRMYRDPELLAVYEQGDKNSKGQTRHDFIHGDEVRDLAMRLTSQIDAVFPGKLDEVTKEFVIPCAAWLHDIGRAINIDKHDIEGARLAKKYLEKHNVPQPLRQRICQLIALHRSHSVIKRGIRNPEHAIVVIADKCIGDEARVRPDKAFALKAARLVRWGGWSLARVNLWDNAPHDRVNFAIKNADLVLDIGESEKQIVLKLTIDERIATMKEIVTLDWFADSFFACGKAAKYFDFVFRIEFNGVRHFWDKSAFNGKGGWVPMAIISIPLRNDRP